MSNKITIISCCLVAIAILNSVPPTRAFGFDLFDLLFGSDESSEETGEMVISAKKNTTVKVICEQDCNLTVMCINCKNINAQTMPANGNGASTSPTPTATTVSSAIMPMTSMDEMASMNPMTDDSR